MKHLRLVVATCLLLGHAVSALAQDLPVRLEGRVQWLSGQTLVLAPDGAPSITVDVSQVPQDQQGGLREGDRVVITGAVPNERNRVVAAGVQRVGP